MYDMAETAAATDAWWAGLARHFGESGMADVPRNLTRPGEGAAFWLRNDLLFSQTCGYPFLTALAGQVSLLATPCYDAPGCEDADYCSLVLVAETSGCDRFEDLRGRRCAINGVDSWSGHHALRLLIAVEGWAGGKFCDVLETGSHAASIKAIASGKADFAAVDCVTHANLARHRPAAVEGTRVLCRTPAMPGLPLIAGRAASPADVEAMRRSLTAALEDPHLVEVRAKLGITGMRWLRNGDYERLSVGLWTAKSAGVGPML